MLATFCLAALIYAEARGEPLDGRLLVAETVYNRMDHGAYPDSVCAVVTEANQYSLPQSVDEYEAWRTSWLIAAAVTSDPEGTLPRTGATHFYSGKTKPHWAKVYPLVATSAGHKFYRTTR
jgi:spore germination cell wall hydrolase CwlJ-like protein